MPKNRRRWTSQLRQNANARLLHLCVPFEPSTGWWCPPVLVRANLLYSLIQTLISSGNTRNNVLSALWASLSQVKWKQTSSQGMPQVASKPPEATAEAWSRISPPPLRRNQSCRYPDLRLAASRTIRLEHPVCDALKQQLWQTSTSRKQSSCTFPREPVTGLNLQDQSIQRAYKKAPQWSPSGSAERAQRPVLSRSPAEKPRAGDSAVCLGEPSFCPVSECFTPLLSGTVLPVTTASVCFGLLVSPAKTGKKEES